MQYKKEEKGYSFLVKKILIPLSAIGAVVIFFLSYNTYLVDHSLEDLKFALDQAARAQSITEMEGLGLLLDDVLIQEVSSNKASSFNITTLEFTRNVVDKGGIKEQLQDIEFLLRRVISNREKKRGSLPLALDRMNEDLQNFIRFFTKELPAGSLYQEIFKSTADSIDFSILERAKKYEENWQLKEAISAYEEFINKYPSYSQLRLVKLRLGDSYFRSMDYREAKRIYEKIIQEAPQSNEAKIADIFLLKVKDKIKKRTEKQKIDEVVSKLTNEDSFAAEYKELGIVNAYLEKLDNETKDLIVYVMKGSETPSAQVGQDINLTVLNRAKDCESKWMLKEAQRAYEEFIAKYPAYEKIVSVKMFLGDVYLKSMQYEKALETYGEIVGNYPDSKERDLAKKFVAVTKEIMAVYEKRQILIDKIAKLKLAPELADAYYNLGMVNIYIFDLKNAQNAFKKVIELVPGTELAKRAEFLLAWEYKFGAEYKKGIVTFSRLVDKYPRDKVAADSTYHIADSYYKWEKFEEAARGYENFAEQYPDSSISTLSLLQAGYTYLYNLHNPLKASEVFKKLRARYPETDIASYISVRLVPTAERSYRDYGFILLREWKIEKAKEAFKQAIAINKEDAWSYCGLGTAYTLSASLDEAFETANEGLKRTSDEYTHATLGFVYDRKKDYLEAIEEYRKSISKNPGYLIGHYNLGRRYLTMGWYDMAINEFKETIKIAGDFSEAHNNLGTAYWYKGQIVDAEFEYKAALSYNSKLPEAYYNLGILYETSERYGMAAENFKKALFIRPDLEIVEKRLKRVKAKMGK